MTAPPFDRFHRFEELTELLRGWAADYTDLVELSSLGRSHEDRPIWLVTVTDVRTGPASEKPALWVDGNVHSAEVASSMAALHLIHRLLSGFGVDPRITHALDTRVFYVVPRLSPDGAEWYSLRRHGVCGRRPVPIRRRGAGRAGAGGR